MHARMRRSAYALVAVAAVSAAVVAAPSRAGDPTSPCRAAQLRGRLLNSTGAAGTIVLSITLRNVGAPCRIKGYTGLRLWNAAHGLLPTRVVHGGLSVLNQVPRRVLLPYGGRATVLVAYSDVPTGSERTCAHSTRLLVRPPDQTGWLRVAVQADACNHGTLRESPVLAGLHHAP